MQRKRKFSYNCRRNCPGGYEVDGEREGRGCLGATAAVCGDPELLPGGDVGQWGGGSLKESWAAVWPELKVKEGLG